MADPKYKAGDRVITQEWKKLSCVWEGALGRKATVIDVDPDMWTHYNRYTLLYHDTGRKSGIWYFEEQLRLEEDDIPL